MTHWPSPLKQEPADDDQRHAPRQHIQKRWVSWRFLVSALIGALLLIGILGAGLVWYGSQPQFASKVRRTVIATLQHATGGRVDIGAFRWNIRNLSIDIDNLTIHGREAPDQRPYLHVDRLRLRAKIISFLSPEIVLSSVVAQGPTIHLIAYPNGSTNQPEPRVPSKYSLQQTLFNLAIDRTRVQKGMLLINDFAVPWEMAAGPLHLDMRYNSREKEYAATLRTKNITFKLKNTQQAHSEVTAKIALDRNAIRVQSLELNTGKSHLAIAGALQDFSHPAWNLTARGAVDAREVGAIGGIDELRNGAAQINLQAHGASANAVAAQKSKTGDLNSDSANFQVTGHVDLRSGEWESPWLRLRNVELHTNLIVDDDQCSLTDFSSMLEDQGRITGSLIMKHCVGPSKPANLRAGEMPAYAAQHSAHAKSGPRNLMARLRRRSSAARVQSSRPNSAVGQRRYQPLQAEMRAHVSDVTLPLILDAVAPKQYSNIGFATAASGEVTGHWTGNGNGLVVSGVLTMRAPRQLMGLIPVSGTARASYLGNHRDLVIDQADVDTPGTKVHSYGTLTLLTNDLKSNLHLDVVGTNLGEFDRLLTVLDLRTTPMNEPHTLPLQLLGTATFHGDVHGSFFALQAIGHLDAQRFQMLVEKSAKAVQNPATRTIHLLTWDKFHADLSYKPWRLIVRKALLVRGKTVIHMAIDLSPHRTALATKTDSDVYTFDKQTRMTASLQAAHVSLAELQSVLGTRYQASGELAADAHVTGDVEDMHGAGQLKLDQASIAGQAIPKASVQLAAQGNVISATRLQAESAAGSAVGKISYDYQTGGLQGDLTGSGFDLTKVVALENKRMPVGGILNFQLHAAGSTQAPSLTSTLQIQNMSLNRVAMGRFQTEANLNGGTLFINSRADLLQTHFVAAGQVQLEGEYPAQLQVTFADFNIDPVLRLVSPSGFGRQSALNGRIEMRGPLQRPSAIQADAHFDSLRATVGVLPISSQGPIIASLRNGVVQLQELRLVGKNLDVSTAGTLGLFQNSQLRLHSEGTINPAMAVLFYPELQTSGSMRFVLNAGGNLRQPDLRGTAQIKNVSLHVPSLTNGITDMNGDLVFDRDRLVLENVTGYSGGGPLTLTGFLGYRNGAYVDVTATTKDVRIRYPKGISSSVDTKLRLLGKTDSLLLSGDVNLMRFGIGNTMDLTSLATGNSGVSAPVDPTSPLNRVRLDLHVTSAPELGFQNSIATLAGDVNLRVRGTLENPSVLGRVSITQGTASVAGTTYHLQQGAIVFADPVTISPEIDLEATARVQDYDIIITLHGPPSKLNISYRSEPPLTQSDVLALLALGRTNEQAAMYGEQEQQGANLTSEALLGTALNTAVSSRVQKLFGVGSVRVDPNFVGALGESTARVTVEEQVGKDITLTFATNINTTAQQLLQAEYDLTRNVSIIAVRDEADVFSMYLQIRGKHK